MSAVVTCLMWWRILTFRTAISNVNKWFKNCHIFVLYFKGLKDSFDWQPRLSEYPSSGNLDQALKKVSECNKEL